MTASRCVILVVDDERLIRALVQEALVLLGYDVITAESGDEALSIVASETPIDVIVTDVIMPGETNGFALIEYAKSMRTGIHAIVMSGYVANHADRISVADRFLHKPFTLSTLDRTLQSLMLQKCA